MNKIKMQTTGWKFISEPAARWMAIDALLLATKLNLDARSLYIGAIADSLSRWLADEGPGEDLLSKGLYSSIAISLDQQRLGYQLAKQHFPNIHSNDLVPLGRVIVHMMSGQSQSNSISSEQRGVVAQLRPEA